jgi:Terminase small subunit
VSQDRPSTDELARALTPKERAFAEFYAGSARGNAARAAEMAGYSKKSKESLAAQGSRTLRFVKVRAYIDALLSATSRSAAEVTREISEIAFSDLSPYLDTDGRELWLDYQKLKDDGKLHLVAGFEFNKRGDVIPVLHNKQAALALLVRVLGMGSEKVEHAGTVGITIREYPEGV